MTFVCLYTSVCECLFSLCVRMGVSVCLCVYACARRSEVNIRYLSQSVSTLFFRQGLLTNQGHPYLTGQAEQQTPGVLLPPLGHPEVTGVPTQVPKPAQQTLYQLGHLPSLPVTDNFIL